MKVKSTFVVLDHNGTHTVIVNVALCGTCHGYRVVKSTGVGRHYAHCSTCDGTGLENWMLIPRIDESHQKLGEQFNSGGVIVRTNNPELPPCPLEDDDLVYTMEESSSETNEVYLPITGKEYLASKKPGKVLPPEKKTE